MDEPGDARRGLPAPVLRGRSRGAAARADGSRAEAWREARSARSGPWQGADDRRGATRSRDEPSPPGGRARELRRSPHLSCGRRLLRLAVRRPTRARPHQRQFGRRPLRDGVERERRRPDPARSDAERPGLAGLVLHPRDLAARHEARRARVQGDGAGALCARPGDRAGRRRARHDVRHDGGDAVPLRVAAPRASVPGDARSDARPPLRRHRRWRPAHARRSPGALGAPGAPALRR